MFQYSAGTQLALANGCQCKLDISGFNNYGLHNGYELELFNIKTEIATMQDVSALAGPSSRLARLLRKTIGVGKKTYYLEKNFAFDNSFFAMKFPAYIDGYWQSYKYFEPIADQIRRELTFSKPLEGRNDELAQLIAQVNAVSIHIRRGDYVAIKAVNAVHGFVGIAYYKAAMQRILNEVYTPHFFVFSDDMEWARAKLGLLDNVTFVEHNTGSFSYEDMRLMSLCRHHIIANSFLVGEEHG